MSKKKRMSTMQVTIDAVKGDKKAPISRSSRAGLQFPVGRIHRYLKKGKYAKRIGAGAPVFLAAVLEYLTSEVIELAGDICEEHKNMRILPRHIQKALRSDADLNKLVAGVTLHETPLVQHIDPFLLKKKSKKKRR